MTGEVDRDALMAAGWKQGAVIDREHVSEGHSAAHFVILSQTCDILNGSLVAEPTVELLPIVLKPGKNKPDRNLANGVNPRKIEFQVAVKGQLKWHSANISGLYFLPRQRLIGCSPSDIVSVDPGTLSSLLNWRIARYTRTAFPEAFEKAWKTNQVELKGAITAHEHLIDSMLISLDPFDEITTGEQYEVEIILLIEPQIYADPSHALALAEVASNLRAQLDTIPDFIFPSCAVLPLDGLTLWDRRKFLDFSRYDYLSFGGE